MPWPGSGGCAPRVSLPALPLKKATKGFNHFLSLSLSLDGEREREVHMPLGIKRDLELP